MKKKPGRGTRAGEDMSDVRDPTPARGLIAKIKQLPPDDRTLLRKVLASRLKRDLTFSAVTGLCGRAVSDDATGTVLVTGEMNACLGPFNLLPADSQREVLAKIPTDHTLKELVTYENRQTQRQRARQRRRPAPNSHQGKLLRVIQEWPNLEGLAYCRKVDEVGIATPLKWRMSGCPSSYEEAYKQVPILSTFNWKKRINSEKSRLRVCRGD